MFKNLKIGIRLTLSLFLIAVISVSVIGTITYQKSKVSLEKTSFNRLTAVREMKASQVEDYFDEINNQVLTFSKNPTIVEAMKEFTIGFNQLEGDLAYNKQEIDSINNNIKKYYTNNYLPHLNQNLSQPTSLNKELSKSSTTLLLQNIYLVNNPYEFGKKHLYNAADENTNYTKTHNKYHPTIEEYLSKFGYYDIFLIEPTSGNIVYSVYKEVDFGTSLTSGPFSQTNIAKAYQAAVKAKNTDFSQIVDYAPYHPSYNAHAAFISSPIYDKDSLVGVLCFQMPIDKINNIMTNHNGWKSVGLGNSGETYIVGADYKLRNQSRFLIEDSTNYFKMISAIGTPKNIINQIRNLKTTIGLQKVKTEGTENALLGKTGTEIFKDYRGVEVLSAFKPLKLENLDWVILSEIDEEEAFKPISELKAYIISVFGVLLILIIVIAWVMSRRITKPLKKLTIAAQQLTKGNMNVNIQVSGKDEIGILGLSIKKMQISIKNLVTDLKDINQNLEHKVEERTLEIEQQKDMLSEKNREIIDSINYAKRIQAAILPPKKIVKKYLKESFVLYKPKDIVAGDFYWLESVPELGDKKGKSKVLFAAADCTGHGVPGAMVSVVCNNALNRVVRENGLTKPSAILDKTRELIIDEFAVGSHNDNSDDETVKDGMDIALCSLSYQFEHKKSNAVALLEYAGAHNPLWIVRHAELEPVVPETEENKIIKRTEINDFILYEIKANKQPIGQFDDLKPYTNHTFELEKGDALYLFSDGFVDQFGGEKGKKFKTRAFRELLLTIQEKPMEEQKVIIDNAFEHWRGNNEQVDDVCVIGVKI